MMDDEINPCPLERQIVGPQGAILLRRHHQHVERCVKAIARRSQPGWSRFHDRYQIEEAA
jgi:hypothetical protein